LDFILGNDVVFPNSAASNLLGLIFTQKYTLGTGGTILSLSVSVATPAGSIILGIYDNNITSSGPGNLLAETPLLPSLSGLITSNVLVPVFLVPGDYWLAFSVTDNAITLHSDGISAAQSFGFTYFPGSLAPNLNFPFTFSALMIFQETNYATLAGPGCPQATTIFATTSMTSSERKSDV
jgi:hypothetical protein